MFRMKGNLPDATISLDGGFLLRRRRISTKQGQEQSSDRARRLARPAWLKLLGNFKPDEPDHLEAGQEEQRPPDTAALKCSRL